MKPSDFVHLHSHTMYSLLDGASKLGDIAQVAAQWGMPAVAMTDHGNMFGAIDFYRAMKAVNVTPIIGCEVYCARESRFDRKPSPGLQSGSNHLVLLAKDNTGYKNLIKLVSAGYLEGFYYNPRIDKALLREHAEGLVCLSACVGGEIPFILENEGYKAAQNMVEVYLDIFGDDYYLEIQRHGIDKEKVINPGLIKLHKEMGVPLVATNDSHFTRAGDHEAHAALVAIQTGKTLNDPNRMCYPEGVYFKSAQEMYDLFEDMPSVLETTLEIAEKCSHLEISFDDYQPPDFPIPDAFDSAGAYLEHLTRQGLEERGTVMTPEHEERLKFELGIINETGYPGYFLIVGDFIRYAREAGIRSGARGSAVGSLVAYALRISTVDPLKYGLFFERFLNPERISPPDIDIDMADRDREKLINYVVEKYGRDNVCQIITFGTLGAKGVIRDVGRVLDLPFSEVDKISKLVPAELKMTLGKALDMVPELKKMSQGGGVGEKLLGIGKQLEGLARHASIHAAAVVITPRPVTEYMPLYKAPKGGEVVTQYNWHHVEDLGFLKMDFLGLRNLSLLDDTVKMIADNYGETVDIDNLPLDDQETYELFGRGDTTGVFQFESNGMRDYLIKLRPDRIEDIIAMTALYRPGPMKYIPNYIARKHGREKVTFDHPILEPSLEETYGIILYQEQVMRIGRDMAGFSLGQADGIRKAMGKKLADEMEKWRVGFVEGALARDVTRPVAEKIWADIEVFAGYAFNKSHSAAYAIVSYQCAFLKAHYPAEYMAANLNSEIGDIDRLVVLIEEGRRMALDVLPPDVNESQVDFVARHGEIRMGMAAIRNVGRSAVEAIVTAREAGQPFASLFDFCERVDLRSVNRRAVESLIRAGAFDQLGGHRAQLLEGLGRALDMAQSAQSDRARGQISLFEGAAGETHAGLVNDQTLPQATEWNERDRLTHEKDVIGFYLSGHPLTPYKTDLLEMGIRTVKDLEGMPDGGEVQVGGIILEVKPHVDKNGRPMAFGALEDMQGSVDLVVFPDAYEKLRDQFVVDQMVVLQGRFSGRNGRSSIHVEQILAIDQAREALADTVNVLLPAEAIRMERLEALKNLCMRYPGACQLRLHIDVGGDHPTVVVSRRMEVAPSDGLISEICSLAEGNVKAWASREAGRARRAARRVEIPETELEITDVPEAEFDEEELVAV
jgi:DNA polymerase III subunit alpha